MLERDLNSVIGRPLVDQDRLNVKTMGLLSGDHRQQIVKMFGFVQSSDQNTCAHGITTEFGLS